MAQGRLTAASARVLRVLLEDVKEPRYGFELMQRTGLQSGTIYPLLARLEEAGWLVSSWEAVDPTEAGRPKRREYRLDDKAAQLVRSSLAEFDAAERTLQAGHLTLHPGVASA